MMKKLASIDLETLNTRTDSVILEIGITVGDDQGKVIEQFQVFPSVEEQIAEGRTISGDTILWWFKQDSDALAEQANAKRLSLDECRMHLAEFIVKHFSGSLILGNAPSFDCEILADFIGKKPWPFYLERDVRTARMSLTAEEKAINHAEHSGLADSEAQYKDFVTFLSKHP